MRFATLTGVQTVFLLNFQMLATIRPYLSYALIFSIPIQSFFAVIVNLPLRPAHNFDLLTRWASTWVDGPQCCSWHGGMQFYRHTYQTRPVHVLHA